MKDEPKAAVICVNVIALCLLLAVIINELLYTVNLNNILEAGYRPKFDSAGRIIEVVREAP